MKQCISMHIIYEQKIVLEQKRISGENKNCPISKKVKEVVGYFGLLMFYHINGISVLNSSEHESQLDHCVD